MQAKASPSDRPSIPSRSAARTRVPAQASGTGETPFLFGTQPDSWTPVRSDDWTLLQHPGRTTLLLAVSGILLVAIFRAVPELDVAASRVFFVQGDDCGVGVMCGVFPANLDPFWNVVREAGLALPRWIMAGAASWWLFSVLLQPSTTRLQLAASTSGVVAAICGPWLLVNALLKEVWGRPRPFRTQEFGGEVPYIAPGSISEHCASNCSFVSGEATAAFWMVWLVVLVPARFRVAALFVIVPVAALISGLRVAFGRHYVSDVMVAACIGAGSVTVVVWALQTQRGRALIERWCAWSNRLASRLPIWR